MKPTMDIRPSPKDSIILLVLFFVKGVSANDLAGMVGAGCVSVVFLVVVIAFIAFGANWNKFYGDLMSKQRKSKAPKAYLKWKKEENARQLARSSASVKSGRANGTVPSKHMDTVSWVHNGSQHGSHYINPYDNPYEEKVGKMDLGAENEDTIQIEAELVDNEVLDVGPYKGVSNGAKPLKGGVYHEPYIYTTSPNSNASVIARSSDANGGWVSSRSSGNPLIEPESPGSAFEMTKTTNLDDILIRT